MSGLMTANCHRVLVLLCCQLCYSPLSVCHFHMAEPSALFLVQAQDSDGYSPLMEAAHQGHLAVARQLLRARADAAMVDKVCSWGAPAT